jgi:hypothetical protein
MLNLCVTNLGGECHALRASLNQARTDILKNNKENATLKSMLQRVLMSNGTSGG